MAPKLFISEAEPVPDAEKSWALAVRVTASRAAAGRGSSAERGRIFMGEAG